MSKNYIKYFHFDKLLYLIYKSAICRAVGRVMPWLAPYMISKSGLRHIC